MSEIEAWLRDRGFERHARAFAEQSVGLDLLADLSDDDLKTLGVTALGDRKRLLRAIAAQAAPAAPPSAAVQPVPAAGAQETPRDAGRRQLTVMFCDLVGSTALSGRLDPEDLQQLVGTYHAVVGTAVAPYDGHVAQWLGDGALVYFGYPQAHEDDAARALQAALAIVRSLAALHPLDGVTLLARIGIATGRVVVGELGAGTPAAEISASGATPNLAARLQAHAGPGEIVLSDDTRSLVGDQFVFDALGPLDLKGLAAPVPAWRLRHERPAATRFEAQHRQGMAAFIGRDSEVALLLDRWALARDGEGQIVLLSGEAGIGKSRICQTLTERLAGESTPVVLQCSPYCSSSALHPVIRHLERTAGIAPADPPEIRAGKLERIAAGLPARHLGALLRLLGLADGGRGAPDTASPQEQKAHTLEALIDLLHQVSAQQPVLLLIEDAHWIDPTTEALIDLLAQPLRSARVLVVVTCRPEYAPAWRGASPLTRLSLSRLPRRQCRSLVLAVTGGKPLPEAVLAEIIGKTDGIPLFVEELTKTVLQSGLLDEEPSGYRLRGPLPALAIPATLQDSLMARLDRLGQSKEVAQAGAVIGRDFSHRLIAAMLSDMPASRLDAALDELVAAELVFRRGTPPEASYSFKHALVRDTAYHSLLRSQRALHHRRIAALLDADPGEAGPGHHELRARHHQEGADPAAALRCWQAAGDQAFERSAIHEAATHYQSAIALLDSAPPGGDGAEVELRLRLGLGTAVAQTAGFTAPGAKENFVRAGELARALDRPDERFQAARGIAAGLSAAGRFAEAIALLDRFGPSDLQRMTPMNRVLRLAAMSYPRTLRGELTQAGSALNEARRELERIGAAGGRWPLLGGIDAMVAVLIWLHINLLLRGRLASANAAIREALAIAEQGSNAMSLAWALVNLGTMSATKGDWRDAIERNTRALEVSTRDDLGAYSAMAKFGIGQALTATGHPDQGTRLLREGFSGWLSFGGSFYGTYFAAEAARVLLDAGRREDATEFITAGETAQHETEETFQVSAFLLLRGRLAMLDGDAASAEASYRQAMATARRQQCWLLALRAGTALARLYRSQDRPLDAAAALGPILQRFTEGFDCPDLILARSALE